MATLRSLSRLPAIITGGQTQLGGPNGIAADGCRYRKLNPNILMMKTAQNWNARDVADRLSAPKERGVFVQTDECGADRSTGIALEDAAQVRVCVANC